MLARPVNALFSACVLSFVVFSLGAVRIYSRVATTQVGYSIGELKRQESALLEQRSRLKLRLATLTTRKSLEVLSEDHSTEPRRQVASNKALAVQ